jgi:hypothetical protein
VHSQQFIVPDRKLRYGMTFMSRIHSLRDKKKRILVDTLSLNQFQNEICVIFVIVNNLDDIGIEIQGKIQVL